MIKSRKGQEGFTLIELLVVVLIIGILAAIAIPAFLGQKKGAQDSNAKSLLRNAAIAMESYYADNQNFDKPGATGTALLGPKTAGTTSLADVEPNITWSVGGSGALAKDNTVDVTLVPSGGSGTVNDQYVLTTQSASTQWFSYSRDKDAKTVKCKDAAEATALVPTCSTTW